MIGIIKIAVKNVMVIADIVMNRNRFELANTLPPELLIKNSVSSIE